MSLHYPPPKQSTTSHLPSQFCSYIKSTWHPSHLPTYFIYIWFTPLKVDPLWKHPLLVATSSTGSAQAVTTVYCPVLFCISCTFSSFAAKWPVWWLQKHVITDVPTCTATVTGSPTVACHCHCSSLAVCCNCCVITVAVIAVFTVPLLTTPNRVLTLSDNYRLSLPAEWATFMRWTGLDEVVQNVSDDPVIWLVLCLCYIWFCWGDWGAWGEGRSGSRGGRGVSFFNDEVHYCYHSDLHCWEN